MSPTDTMGSTREEVLQHSYRHCQQIAKRTGRNFYYSFLVLPARQRQAMCALYTFMRKTDDLGDADLPPEQRRVLLQQWRNDLRDALANDPMELAQTEPMWPAFADTVNRYGIDPEHLYAVLDGCEADLDVIRYQTFDELQKYCYQVASAVGLSCIRIWGVKDRAADLPAEKCGLAFQLTNIVRDVAEDYQRGRIYLPQEDLKRFSVTEEDLLQRPVADNVVSLLRFELNRAEGFYREAEELFNYLPPAGQAVQRAMINIYHGLHRQITKDPAAVFQRRVSLSATRKLALAASALPLRFFPNRS